ncbi:MAG: hypothetical protein A3D95_00890 [Betaproteobacteria bacterium RIFCSPHIGHO2_12_FULL_69_13]|nr:MAG: hypothetical protein A3D95_00890 [Betaproteobacteria bacterium RIFCSPHIGHO2_12_FULL_69_13]OGA65733.1 MAG: hypothetical protein A3G83_02330 [Betaproteobacteria bacterium RIFCSPLOWO2_12_FULL_68_20]
MSDAARAARAAETRILLCHRLNLGDLVLASPALQWFARRNPGVHFGLYTNDFAARVGELLPGIERVIRYRKFDAYGLPEWRALLEARRWRPESVIGLTPAADWRLALRVRLLGGRVAAGAPEGAPRHVAERLAWLLGWRGEEVLPPVRLAMPRGNGAGRDVAIWVSARKPSNRPRAAQVLEIVRALRARRPGVTIGVFALPERSDNAAHLPDAEEQAALAAGLADVGLGLETPLLDRFLGELASSGSVISPDGGIAHIAAGFGKPVVVLSGNVDIEAWRPYSPLARSLQAPSRRVADLRPEEIVAAWQSGVARPA